MEAYSRTFTDFELSPYTGLTRESWVEAARYLLTGIFENIPDMDSPVVVSRTETKITYPHEGVSPERYDAERRAEIFEGLTRSLFIAAPVIKEAPDYAINGIVLREYYKKHLLLAATKGEYLGAGTYEELQEKTASADPFRAYQQTVETCAMVIGLWETEDVIWKTYTKEEQDTIASFISGFAHAATVPQNWRLFNMLDLAFLNMNGYEIEKDVMRDHAQAILNYSVGDGWYRDGQSFDYYSCWAFNVYAPIWNVWYGYRNEPYIAARFEQISNNLCATYPYFFDRDGFVNMWGRSCIYRNAATAPLAANFFLNDPKMDPGLARRISSGALLQFLMRDDLLSGGVPSLGFYKQFSPLVQGYSCAESPLWLGKAFLCLHLPADHPFWTAKETGGDWEKLTPYSIKETMLYGPALCYTNHGATGETVLRSAKVLKDKNDVHGMHNYSKLCYNTKYPWEATPVEEGKEDRVESQQYVLKDMVSESTSLANATFFCKKEEGVLYRRQFFEFSTNTEMHWLESISLADFPVRYGIIRTDKLRLFRAPAELTLGAYGFPNNGTMVKRLQKGNAKAIVLTGKNHMGNPKQLAMTVYDGFYDIDIIKSEGTNPDSESSIVVYGKAKREKLYGGNECYMLISQVITKEDATPFTDDEIFPIKEIRYDDAERTGAYGYVTLVLADGNRRRVSFENIENDMRI